MIKKCKYCGVGTYWSYNKYHRHCKNAYNRGQLMQMFTDEEVDNIKRVIKSLKYFV